MPTFGYLPYQGWAMLFYLPHSQTFSRKFLASFGRNVYLCIRLAALGNLKASFHCAHWHNLCIKNEES